jgi:hypothetical protein
VQNSKVHDTSEPRKELRQLRVLPLEVNGGKKITCVLIHSAGAIQKRKLYRESAYELVGEFE